MCFYTDQQQCFSFDLSQILHLQEDDLYTLGHRELIFLGSSDFQPQLSCVVVPSVPVNLEVQIYSI